MKSINFDEGYEQYMIGDDPSRVIKIRIGDPNLLKRIKAAIEKTDVLLEKYKNADVESMTEFDKEFREIINTAFDSDVCTPAFGDSNVTTLTSSGDFLFTAFFDALMPQLEADIKAKVMTKKINADVRPEVKKYLDAPTVKPVAALAQPYSTAPDISSLTPEQKKALLAQLLS